MLVGKAYISCAALYMLEKINFEALLSPRYSRHGPNVKESDQWLCLCSPIQELTFAHCSFPTETRHIHCYLASAFALLLHSFQKINGYRYETS